MLDYDPQHTMLALNMAIVSVNRILTTQDRTILQQEYDRIINRLALGNIESDTEMKGLYSELVGFITGKGLRQEDLRRLRESYSKREKEAFYRAISHGFDNLNAPQSDKLWGWLGGLAVSSVSALGAGYYDYSASMEQIHREITSGTWQLRKIEAGRCQRVS